MLDEYIFNLMNDTRDGKRKGFDWNILVAINSLQQYHHAKYPHLVESDSDPIARYRQYRL